MRISRFNILVFVNILFFALLFGVIGGVFVAKKNLDNQGDSENKNLNNNIFPLSKNDAGQYFFYCRLVTLEKVNITINDSVSIRYTGNCQYLDKDSRLTQVTLPLGIVNNTSKESLILGYGVFDDVFADEAINVMLTKFEQKNTVITFFDETPNIQNSETRTPEKFLNSFSSATNTPELLSDFTSKGQVKKIGKMKNDPAFFVTNMTEVQL